MTKENYLESVQSIEESISELRAKLNLLKNEYISENKQFEIGDKINIFSPSYTHWNSVVPEKNKIAYVSGYELNYYGSLSYVLRKAKKDGSMSSVKEYHSSKDVLTLIERTTV